MKKVLLIFSLSFCLLIFSCKNDEHNSEEMNTDNSQASTSSEMKLTILSDTQDEMSGVLEMNKETIPKMVPVELKLSLMNRAGEKLQKADITLDLIMPDMKMPENKVKLKEAQEGIYTGTAMFTMKGDWRAVALINLNNENKELNFDFEVK